MSEYPVQSTEQQPESGERETSSPTSPEETGRHPKSTSPRNQSTVEMRFVHPLNPAKTLRIMATVAQDTESLVMLYIAREVTGSNAHGAASSVNTDESVSPSHGEVGEAGEAGEVGETGEGQNRKEEGL